MTNQKLTSKDITKFILPSIMVMIFISIYTIVDSIFVSRFVGSNALAAINISLPLYSIAFACGIMFATGGGAIIAIQLGKQQDKEANENFTALMSVGTVFGIVATILCLIFKDPIINFLGPSVNLRGYVNSYSFYLIIAFPFLVAKVIFESILRVDGTPNTALAMTVVGGVLNIIFDYAFIVILGMGIAGAGLGTLLGIVLSNSIGFLYFFSSKSKLKFKLAKPNMKFMISTITNGSSEMVNEFSIALTTLIFNMLTLKYLGDDGVAAISILLALNFLIVSVFIGFSTGVAPLISFNHGSENKANIKRLLQYSVKFIAGSSIILFIIGFVFNKYLVQIYTDVNSPVYAISIQGMKYFSISFLFVGINIFGSAFFTAFENGKISALISFIKSFVFFIIAALTIPALFGSTGIWFITPLAEFLSIFLVGFFMLKYQDAYGYQLLLQKQD